MKKLNYWSADEATKIIQKYKDDTAYFSKDVTMEEMWQMFHQLHFGEAETAIILAALIKVGAKFKQVPVTEYNEETIKHIKSMIQ